MLEAESSIRPAEVPPRSIFQPVQVVHAVDHADLGLTGGATRLAANWRSPGNE